MFLVFCAIVPLLTAAWAEQDLPTAKPEEVGVCPEKVQGLSTFMQSLVDQGQIAGGITMMARHGKVIHLEAVGMADREEKKPMRTGSIFRIASMTKPITSVAIMMLCEQGKLDLDEPVSKYIPEFEKPQVLVSVEPLVTRPGERLREILALEGLEASGMMTLSSDYPYAASHVAESGGAGLSSTMTDYMRFCQMLLNGGELNRKRLLAESTVAMMTKNQIGDLYVGKSDMKFGFGFAVSATRCGKMAIKIPSGQVRPTSGASRWPWPTRGCT